MGPTDFVKDASIRPTGTFPGRLVLGIDQFFKATEYNGELGRLAHRKAHSDAISRGLQGADLLAHVARSTEALRVNDATLRAEAFSTVVLDTWSPWSPAESELPARGFGKVGRIDDEKFLNASRWRSVAEIPDFPFASFTEMLSAVAAGRCYISVPSTGFRFTNLTSARAAQAFGGFLSWVPLLAALASVVAAIRWKNGWMLLGMPAAVFGFVAGASSISLVRPLLFTAQRDPAISLPLRLMAWMLSVLFRPIVGAFLGPILFAWMLFTDRQAAAWIVASYVISVHSVRVFRALGTIALRTAAKKSEAFFLFALSQGLCGLRDKTGEFLRQPERAQL